LELFFKTISITHTIVPNFVDMMRNSRSVSFHFLYNPVPLRRRKKLKDFIASLFQEEGRRLEHLNYIFCTDEYLLQLNTTYLNHDTLTDVITFDLSENKGTIIGESYISIERVMENALLIHTSFTNELHRVIFHSVLHLCGYKDKTTQQKQEMRSKEDEYLDRYFVPRETI
jgi:rRNA maturation RNase YbeY